MCNWLKPNQCIASHAQIRHAQNQACIDFIVYGVYIYVCIHAIGKSWCYGTMNCTHTQAHTWF